MKRFLSIFLALVLTVGLMAGCGGGKSSSAGEGGPVGVAVLLNGTLGDKAFFDSAASVADLSKDLNYSFKVVEMTYDETKWMPTLVDFSEDPEYPIIIVGTWQMAEKLQEVAPQYPDTQYIIFDSAVDYELEGMENVYSIEYMQNECSFLAGAVAGMSTQTGTIGFVGGMENYVINDFLMGYIQGAKHVNPDIKIHIAYTGDFSDTAKAKELTLAQINQGADIVYQVASTAGLGVIDACTEKGVWAIGVDSDQAEAFLESDPGKANSIMTSALKLVGESLYRTLKLQEEGSLVYGQRVVMGLSDGCVGIAKNDIFEAAVSQEVQDKAEELEQAILSGDIVVDSAFGKTTDEIEAIRATVR